MRKTYALSKLAAAAVTIGGLFLPFSSATAKEGPVVVTAPEPADLVVRRISYADFDLALPDGRSPSATGSASLSATFAPRPICSTTAARNSRRAC